MSDELLVTVVAGPILDYPVADDMADQRAKRLADMSRTVEALVLRGTPARIYATVPATSIVDEGDGFTFLSRAGTQIKLSGSATDDESLLNDLQSAYPEPGVFFVTGTSRFPSIPYINGDTENTVTFTSADDFETMVEAGEFKCLSDQQLTVVRDYVANCGDKAKCPGTLGPKCPRIS